jgi:hypothetical protein
MDVFHLIGRLTLVREHTTMAQKGVGEVLQGMAGRAGSEVRQGTLEAQRDELAKARGKLDKAIHNMDLVSAEIELEIARQEREFESG